MRLGKIGCNPLVKHVFTARDYVQDGLVAMWDSIENAGYGIHSDSPQYWKDLTGGGADWLLNSSPAYSIGPDYVQLNQEVSYAGVGHCTPHWSITDFVTCETVLDPSNFEPSGARNQILSVSVGTGVARGGLYTRDGFITLEYNVYPEVELTASPLSISMIYGNQKAFVNGIPIMTNVGRTSAYTYYAPILGSYAGPVAIGMRIKTYRFYNRELSDEERIANYAVDKLRFNLP